LWKDVTALEISTSSTEPVGLRTSHISDGERLANDRPSGNKQLQTGVREKEKVETKSESATKS
jgi:hypothetical protein